MELDNGRDPTWMWSAELPVGRTFRCPLGWWCDWETHTVGKGFGDSVLNSVSPLI